MAESKTVSADAAAPAAPAAAASGTTVATPPSATTATTTAAEPAPVSAAEPAAAAEAPAAAEPPVAAAPAAEPSPAAAGSVALASTVEPSSATADMTLADSSAGIEKKEDLWDTPNWPLGLHHPLRTFHSRLASILEAAGHAQIWGVTLSAATPAPFSTLLILQKFLRSTQGELDLAAENLQKTLAWRKEFGLDGLEDRSRIKDEADFKGLGYITGVPSLPDGGAKGGERQIVTWNVYGAVSDIKATFGDLPRFLRWRVDLMERAMARLHLESATEVIPDYPAPEDPHRLLQVHVYSGLSFLRLPAEVKAASKATIELMGAHYPETLSRKFFVGVPRLMGWVFGFVRMFVSRETSRKFNIISWEEQLQPELGEGEYVPKRFGGSGPELAELEAKTADM